MNGKIKLISIPVKRLNYLEAIEKLSKKLMPLLERIVEREEATKQFVDFLRKEI